MRCCSGSLRRRGGLWLVERGAPAASLAAILLSFISSGLAADIYYDIEGDTGTTVLDKLTTDGTTNGTLQQNAVITTTAPPYGAQALRFDVGTPPPPLVTLDQYTSFELPDTTDLGTAFTLSAFVDFSNTGLTRLFSSYSGTGAVTGRILFDINRTNLTTPFRFFAGSATATNNAIVPANINDPGYHHVAVTYSNGTPEIYWDGAALGTTFEFDGSFTGITPQNLRFGEDPHDVGGVANEQFNGHVDDILVVNRALSAGEIATIAAQGVSAGYTSAGETKAIHYSFEGDSGTTVTDKLIADGAQNAIAHQMAAVDANAAAAKFGTQSGVLTPVPTVVVPPPPLSRVALGQLGNLGQSVTMAAVVHMDSPGQIGNKLARLFSNFAGSGGAGSSLIFDADPNAGNLVGGVPFGLRVILPGRATSYALNTTFSTGVDHLFAFTYDNGTVKIYLDGVEVGSNTVTGGDLDLGTTNLFFGEDSGGAINEQLVGNADDLLILSRASSASEMMDLFTDGADFVFGFDHANARCQHGRLGGHL